jgi:hypothetical protein
MQRSKIIIDNVSEAKAQLNKIFEYHDHAADIINHCEAKRNFKKRERIDGIFRAFCGIFLRILEIKIDGI